MRVKRYTSMVAHLFGSSIQTAEEEPRCWKVQDGEYLARRIIQTNSCSFTCGKYVNVLDHERLLGHCAQCFRSGTFGASLCPVGTRRRAGIDGPPWQHKTRRPRQHRPKLTRIVDAVDGLCNGGETLADPWEGCVDGNTKGRRR